MKVKIIWERTQDGEAEIAEYEGHYKRLGGSENISFCETENNIRHLLKVTDYALKWIRTIDGESDFSEMEFAADKSSSMDYKTPHGNIPLDIATRSYVLSRHEKTDLPHVYLDYCLKQKGQIVSEYKVTIVVCHSERK